MYIALFEVNDWQRQPQGEDTILPEAHYLMSKQILCFISVADNVLACAEKAAFSAAVCL